MLEKIMQKGIKFTTDSINTAPTNSHVEQLLVRKENIPLLESIIEEKANRTNFLRENHSLDEGDIASYKTVRSLVPELTDFLSSEFEIKIKKQKVGRNFNPSKIAAWISAAGTTMGAALTVGVYFVEPIFSALFGVSTAYIATMTYFHCSDAQELSNQGYGRAIDGGIRYIDAPIVDVTIGLAHEIGHNILKRYSNRRGKYGFISEGICRGIERITGSQYSSKENNFAYEHNPLNQDLGEVRAAYRWICDKHKHSPLDGLGQPVVGADFNEAMHMSMYGRPTEHAIGNSLVLLYEKVLGKGIYKNMVHGRFDFSKSPAELQQQLNS